MLLSFYVQFIRTLMWRDLSTIMLSKAYCFYFVPTRLPTVVPQKTRGLLSALHLNWSTGLVWREGARWGRDGGRGQDWRMVAGNHRVCQAFHRRKRPSARLSVALKRQESCSKRETSLVSSALLNVATLKNKNKKQTNKKTTTTKWTKDQSRKQTVAEQESGLLLIPGLLWSNEYGIEIHFYAGGVAQCVSPQPWNKHRRRGSLCPPRVEEPEKVSGDSKLE